MDVRRKKALDRARKFAAYEDDKGVTEAERDAFTKQLDKLVARWAFTEDELFPPEEDPEVDEPVRGPTFTPPWATGPKRTGPKAPKAKKPNNGGTVDAGEAMEFAADLFGEFFGK
jgi:hypothetical protein